MRVLILCTLFVILGTAACGRWLNKLHGDRDPDELPDSHHTDNSTLVKQVNEVYESNLVADCDEKQRDLKLKIAKALDERHDAIAAFAASLPPSKLYDRIPLGPIVVRKLKDPKTRVSQWEEYSYGWGELEDGFNKIYERPVGAEWLALETSFRSILTDDYNRLVYKDNFFLKRSDYETVQSSLKKTEACLATTDCSTPEYLAAEKSLITSNPFYQPFSGANRSSLEKLKRALQYDANRKGFHKNVTVSFADQSTLILPLDAGPFSTVTEELEKYITDLWTSPDLKVKIKWTTINDEPQAYVIKVGEGAGGRSFVSYKNRSINYFSDVRTISIAHEIGHVLGFPDYYYTSWNANTCLYTTEDNLGDLMSANGIVTPEEWQALRDNYK